ncbi:hypothetical protein [Qipengyuania sp.]|uniref:hypothetical protein n=1 Tax=Qipengyuania sp. TaxID=2004515 RepID=UPI0035C82915
MLRLAARTDIVSAVLSILGASACAEARQGLRAGEQLRAQLKALAHGTGVVLTHAEKYWATLTFKGARHVLKLRFEGRAEIECGEAMLAALDPQALIIPGQLVASIAVVAMDQVNGDAPRLDVTIEALLAEDH